LTSRPSSDAQATPATTPTQAGPRILVAEDERELASLVRALLEDLGYETMVVEDGQEALEAIMREPPALLITDLAMPRMSGEELIERLRQSDHHALPIIVLSARPDAAARIAPFPGVQLLMKPFDIDDFEALVLAALPPAL
jgi:DNA-binding response OmpR family regulator